jgi:hypothetical protein
MAYPFTGNIFEDLKTMERIISGKEARQASQETQIDYRAKALEVLSQKCPYARLEDSTAIKEDNGRFSVDRDSIYCRITKDREIVYTVDSTGNASGMTVLSEKEVKCQHPDNMSGCIVRSAYENGKK